MASTKSLPLEDYKKGRERLKRWRAEELAELETTPEFQIIAKLVENADSTPAIILQQFLELTTSSRDSGTVGTHCSLTSSSLLALSSRTSHEQQSKLVTFMVELKKITILDLQTGEPLLCDSPSGLVWTELPGFGADFSNELHDRCMSVYVQTVSWLFSYYRCRFLMLMGSFRARCRQDTGGHL
jgi:hypothetical protein